MKKYNFIKEVEKLVNPIDVGTIHFIQSINKLLPRFIQDKLMAQSSKKIPYMGFVVEPYSLFLCYEIKDLEQAKSLLPDNFKLVKTKIFNNDEPKYYALFGCFRTHTSAFWGSRIEFYIIAENTKTGLLSWVIIDYDTNSISHDSKHGLRSPNAKSAVITVDYNGLIYVDVKNDQNHRELVVTSDVKNSSYQELDERLWLEGNLSVGYGKELSNNKGDIFSLKFNIGEVEKALLLEKNTTNIEANSWYPGLFYDQPEKIVSFPYAQHFISDSPGHSSSIKNKEEMIAEVNKLDFDNIKVFSTKELKISLVIGMLFSFAFTITLIILLILK